MTILTDFASYIEGILAERGIHKATPETSDLRCIVEYERAKCVLPNDLSTDEYEMALNVIVKWTGV